MSMPQASSEYFQRVANRWDAISAGYFGTAVRDAAIAKSYLRADMTVADIGAGTGFLAAGLAPLVRLVHVVDASPEMLAVARQNLNAFANVEYHQADGLSLPFADASLDAVFANMYLHHIPQPGDAIREMLRVLRPGGRLVITDMDAHPYAWLKEEMADVWQGFDRSQIHNWLAQAGLVNRLVSGTGQSCCASSANPALKDDQGREANISVFLATGTRRLSMRAAVQESYAAAARASSGCGCSSSAETESCCAASETSASNCCGSSAAEDSAAINGYTLADLSSAPREAAEFSLGCGNPLALADLKPGETVIDIGSGGGFDSFLAAARVGPTGRVIGVDMTPDMLERARASAQRSGFGNVEFRQGYAEEMPVEDATADVILSNCVINLTEDKGHVFREAYRALKPGGRLEVSDIVLAGAMPLELQADAAGWSDCITGALPETEYLDLICQAGFQHASVRRRTAVGEAGGVAIYSDIIAAQKPLTVPASACAPDCCG